jgi:hypothetical protein
LALAADPALPTTPILSAYFWSAESDAGISLIRRLL